MFFISLILDTLSNDRYPDDLARFDPVLTKNTFFKIMCFWPKLAFAAFSMFFNSLILDTLFNEG